MQSNVQPSRVTVRDVAALAGVSQATASRVLSGGAAVSPTLTARVRAASDSLGFSVNTAARALRTRRTGTFGIVVPEINNPYFIMLVEALEAELAASDRALLLADARGDAAIEESRVHALLGRLVDGLLVVPVDVATSGRTLDTAAAQVPIVQVDRCVPGLALDYCGVDNAEAMRQICAHLHAGGHRTVAYIGAAALTSSAEDRVQAFRQQAPAHDLEIVGEWLGDFAQSWGAEGATLMLDAGVRPDAVVCGADVVAYGVLRVLRERGVRVGRDVAVVGFDDLDFDVMVSPELTSVRQPMADVAAAAIRLLDARVGGGSHAAVRQYFAPELVVRGSSRGED